MLSSENVGTVYLQYIFENSKVNINALCNSCEDTACCSSASWRSFMLAITSIMRPSYSSRVSTYTRQLTIHTDSHASYSGAARREWRTILGAKFKLLYSETALSRKQFVIGHMYVYTFFCLEWPILSTKNIDISFWDTLYMQLVG